jgi:ABC-type uncharacterized transport system substrate-binding protein
MPQAKKTVLVIFFAFQIMGVFLPHTGNAAPYKVLVIMSYNETQPWESGIREGIESVLKGKTEIKYVYLNTKYDLPHGGENARKAYVLYQEFRPDGVIAADDDAQSLFVVPYLRDKVKTPVMFCGVNAEVGQYGYPAGNVSGIFERAHVSESIALLQQLVPSVKKIAYVATDDPVGRIYKKQIDGESKSYSAKSLPVKLVKNLEEAVSATKELKKRSDALVLLAMASLRGSKDTQPTDREIFRTLSDHFGKPVIGVNDFEIRHGLLCSVAKSGREQGATASKMLLRAMTGTPVPRIPIFTDNEGKRMINVTAMKTLGIRPRPIVLRGVELVNTIE